MINETVDKLARKLAETVPDGLRSMGEDLENNFRNVLKSGLSKMDLVTREEFEVQEAVLARTREKLTHLEDRLTSLEKKPPAKKTSSTKPVSKKSVGKKPARKKATKKG